MLFPRKTHASWQVGSSPSHVHQTLQPSQNYFLFFVFISSSYLPKENGNFQSQQLQEASQVGNVVIGKIYFFFSLVRCTDKNKNNFENGKKFDVQDWGPNPLVRMREFSAEIANYTELSSVMGHKLCCHFNCFSKCQE